MTLLRSKAIESFGDHAGVVLKECISVLLQALNPLTPLLEGSQLPAGRIASLLKGRELGAQFVQRDESLGLLVLVGATFTIHFGKLLCPRLSRSIGVSTCSATLLLYQPLKSRPEKVGGLQQVRDETPHFRLQLVGARLMRVGASLKTVPVSVRASIVIIGIDAPLLG